MKRKIYVASSWRNGYYTEVVDKLREAGQEAGETPEEALLGRIKLSVN